MAFSLFSFATFIILILTNSHLPNTSSAESKHDHKNPSAFDFLNQLWQLTRSRMGQKAKEIPHLKKHLQRIGYLTYQNQSQENDNHFDGTLESAVKTYQLNYHLHPTGGLDPETVQHMARPRCGVADTINPTPEFHIHYSFLPGNPRWPSDKYHLTFGFEPGTPPEAVEPVKRAFKTWETHSHFTFEILEDYRIVDLTVGFYRGEHSDGSPFDGPGGVDAHSFAPQFGIFHYDADENWSDGAKEGAIDLETVAVHEIGHLLGLGHSTVEAAVMYPYGHEGETKTLLHDDDIRGIKALYGN